MATQKSEFELIGDKYVITKPPGSELDYYFNFADWLSPGESIASVVMSYKGVTEISHSNTASVVTYWVRMGAASSTYAQASATVTTDSNPPRKDTRTAYFHIVKG